MQVRIVTENQVCPKHAKQSKWISQFQSTSKETKYLIETDIFTRCQRERVASLSTSQNSSTRGAKPS